ncbi:MAG: tetratricopeptide repeat protein [Patescibacteria group bacterium]
MPRFNVYKKGIIVLAAAVITGGILWFAAGRSEQRQSAPESVDHLEQARNASGTGDFAKAEEEYKKAFETKVPTAKEWSELAYVYQMEQKKSEAISAYESAVRDGTDNAGVLNNLGNLYRDAGHYDKAEDYYKKAVTAGRGFSAAIVNLSHLYNIQQKYDESVRLLLEYYQGTAAQSEIGLQLISTYRAMGDLTQAKKTAQAFLDLHPDNKQAAAIISQL